MNLMDILFGFAIGCVLTVTAVGTNIMVVQGANNDA